MNEVQCDLAQPPLKHFQADIEIWFSYVNSEFNQFIWQLMKDKKNAQQVY